MSLQRIPRFLVSSFVAAASLFGFWGVLVLVAPDPAIAAAKPPSAKAVPKSSKKKARDLSRAEAVLDIAQGGATLGKAVFRLHWDIAPEHVRNFVELAERGFYNGTRFHSVVPGFKVQGGDPLSRLPDRSRHGQGFVEDAKGRPKFLRAELSGRPHVRGTLSMARGTNLDSASSQFFVCLADQPQLNHQYTVFGEVVEGMELFDRIAATPRDGRDNPMTEVIVRKIEIREAASPAEASPVPSAPPGPKGSKSATKKPGA